ncbi:hypothetical protein STEG23_036587 [Scotinomys teguina]
MEVVLKVEVVVEVEEVEVMEEVEEVVEVEEVMEEVEEVEVEVEFLFHKFLPCLEFLPRLSTMMDCDGDLKAKQEPQQEWQHRGGAPWLPAALDPAVEEMKEKMKTKHRILVLSGKVYVEDNLGVMSVGFLLNSPDNAVIWRGPKKNDMTKQVLPGVAWGDVNYLIVDTPPSTSDEHLSVI